MTREMDDPHFLTTRWSLVRSARGDDELARKSLGELCEAYWYPLYAYLRRRGARHEEAQDSVQAFFLFVMQRGDLEGLERDRGSFRGWLSAALRNFVANERARDRALKRGGGVGVLSIDWESGKQRFGAEPQDGRTPEKEFDRAWALETLERGKARLRAEYVERGKGELFDALVGELGVSGEGKARGDLGTELGLKEGALKVAVHRLRQRFGEALRREIGETLEDGGEVDLELGDLMEALGE